MMTIHGVTVDVLDMIWPNVEGEVARACEYSNGEITSDTILESLRENRMRLIIMRNDGEIVAVMTVKIDVFDTGKKVLTAVTVGGHDLDSWVWEIDKTLTDISKEEGCCEMYIVGRQGWVRKLRDIGYNKIHTTVSKKVA